MHFGTLFPLVQAQRIAAANVLRYASCNNYRLNSAHISFSLHSQRCRTPSLRTSGRDCSCGLFMLRSGSPFRANYRVRLMNIGHLTAEKWSGQNRTCRTGATTPDYSRGESRCDAKTLNQKKQGMFYLYFGVGDHPRQRGILGLPRTFRGDQFWRGTIDGVTAHTRLT